MPESTDSSLKTGFRRRATLSAMVFVLGVTIAAGAGRQIFAEGHRWEIADPSSVAAQMDGAIEAAAAELTTADISSIVERLRAKDGGDEGLLTLAKTLLAANESRPGLIAEEDLAMARVMAAASSVVAEDTEDGEGPTDEELAEDAAEAAISFWQVAWQRSWPFFRVIGKGLWYLVTESWRWLTELITIERLD